MQDTTEERKINGKKIAIIVCVCIAAVFLLAKVVVPRIQYHSAYRMYTSSGYTAAEKADSKQRMIKYANVGDTIYFGCYGVKYSRTIEWRVLAKEDNKILVISNKVLEELPYNNSDETESKSVTWATCTLRSWLNSTFIDEAFDSDEQARILSSEVTAELNPEHSDVYPGSDTTDKVFLLSMSEADKYLSSVDEKKCCMTKDLCYRHYYSPITGRPYIESENMPGAWLLRTPWTRESCAFVEEEGYIGWWGSTGGGIRPAMWISLDD